jgi:ligand-binding sensor domain-containing protein
MINFVTMSYGRLILLFFGILFVTNCFCQNPVFFKYSVENIAPSNDIYSIIQDRKGYIWIGSDAGVYRYNGTKFFQFKSKKLKSNSITGLVETKSGKIFGYTFNKQLFYIDKEKVYVIQNWKLPINRIAADKDGFVWITTNNGVYRLEESNLEIEFIKNDFDKGCFSSQAISNRKGNVFFQYGDGILSKEKDQFRKFPIENKNIIHSIILSSNSRNKPWIVDVKGEYIYSFDGKKFLSYSNNGLLKLLKGRKITHLFETDNGKLWIATYSGIICLDIKSGKTELLLEQFSFSNGISDIEGNLWFTTIQNGIIRIPNVEIRQWKSYNELHYSDQYSHLKIANESVCFSSSNGIIGNLNKSNNRFEITNHLPKSDLGMMFFSLKENSLYFNKINDLYRFKNGKINLINTTVGPIKEMFEVPEGYLISSSQGIFFIKNLKEKVTTNNYIDIDWYREIEKSPFSNHYFAACNNGLSVINKKNTRFFIEKKILNQKQIISLTTDTVHNQILALSFDGTIYAINKSFQTKIFKKLDSDLIANRIRVKFGNIYLATNKGIVLINFKTKKLFYFNKYFGISSNNIRALEFDQTFCWAIGDGLQRIPIELLSKKIFRGKIINRAIWINEIKQVLRPKYELNYSDKISFGMDGLSYLSEGDFEFAYRINGKENSWTIVPGKIDKINIANLPNGENSIEFKLIDHNNLDSLNTIKIRFNVKPPFWQRWWFYILITISTLLIAFVIFRWRLNVMKKKQLNELNRISLENELRLTQQNALKAQMNPHFLFNVLNSIKGYIYENDKKNATRYLSDFSNLVRKVLELSDQSLVPLEKELETLNIYIELESMLLQSDFSHTILIDKSVELNEIQVPSLIIQPYVENAFKHGLRHKKGEKRLEIKIEYDEKECLLYIEISDNGIGREAANKINRANAKIYDSFATSAIDKRIQLLNYSRNDIVGVEISDKFVGKEVTGTNVKIRIHV